MKKIAVFCSASQDIDPKYNKVARDFVRAACLCGYGIVSGGTVKGTMGCISDEIRRCGGYHLGVIPRFMEEYIYPHLSETIWTDTMAQRKTIMREGTIAVVALPGGVGTLDELVETIALVHLNKYSGKVILLNHDGFYEIFRDLLRHYVDVGMMTEATFSKVMFAQTSEEIIDMLECE